MYFYLLHIYCCLGPLCSITHIARILESTLHEEWGSFMYVQYLEQCRHIVTENYLLGDSA